ncbi:hypothetical protein BY996DRAFT_6418608 [Phakopsora pachyrhizi]|nr:hypothetical protein BY996DRAFT_6418608 [Phakopsora pachyrhizi]
MISLKNWLSHHLFVSSDCFPTPNSVRAVDDETWSDFERDQASNPFNSKSSFDTYLEVLLDIIKGQVNYWPGRMPVTYNTKDESLGLIVSHWDMVDKLLLVMTNPTIKPMSLIISDAIEANTSLDLKPLMLNVPQRLSNQHILYNNTAAAAAATPYSNINNYSLTMTHGTDSPRGGAESKRRSRLRRKGAIHRPERTLQRSEDIVIPMILRNSSSSFSSSSENRPTTRTSYRIGRIIIHTIVEDDDGNEDLGEGRSWINSDNTQMIEGESVNDDVEDEEDDWEEHIIRARSELGGIEDEPIMRALKNGLKREG